MLGIVSGAASGGVYEYPRVNQAFSVIHTLHSLWSFKKSFEEISADAQYTRQYIAGAVLNWATQFAPGAKPIVAGTAQIAFVSAMFLECIDYYKEFLQAFDDLSNTINEKYWIVVKQDTKNKNLFFQAIDRLNPQLAILLQGKLYLLQVRIEKVYHYTKRFFSVGLKLSHSLMELTEAHSSKFRVLQEEHKMNCLFLNTEKVNRLLPKNREALVTMLKEKESQIDKYLQGIHANYTTKDLMQLVVDSSQVAEDATKTVAATGNVLSFALESMWGATKFIIGSSLESRAVETEKVNYTMMPAEELPFPPIYCRKGAGDLPLELIEQVDA